MKGESGYVGIKRGSKILKEKINAVRRNENKDKRIEDCWELSEGLSLCMRRLSWIRRSEELSLLESIEKLSKDAECPVLQICSLMEEGP